jgi:DNA-directed RNA polymerase subunit RPC12/RpoP
MSVKVSDIFVFGSKSFSVSDFMNTHLKKSATMQSEKSLNKRYMRCPMCGSITPHGHPCVECGYKGNN